MESLYVRSALSSTPKSHNNSTALSPDIICLDIHNVPATGYFADKWADYISNPVRAGVRNHLYVRGEGASDVPLRSHDLHHHHHHGGGSPVVYLYTAPSSLILWPDQWTLQGHRVCQPVMDHKKPLPVPIDANSKPFLFDPTTTTPPGHSLITSTNHDLPIYQTLEDYMKGFVNNSTFACLSNHYVPTNAKNMSYATTLDLRNSTQVQIQLILTVTDMVGCTVSLESDIVGTVLGPVVVAQASQTFTINSDKIGSNLLAHFTLHASPPKNSNGKVSVFVDGATMQLTLALIVGDPSFPTIEPIGSLNISFDAQMKYAFLHELQDDVYNDFYFRDAIGDTNVLPRSYGNVNFSPDLQPYGPFACLDPTGTFVTGTAFQNDFSANNGLGVVAGATNFIYVRGSTPVATSGTVQMWAVPNQLIISPSEWETNPQVVTLTDANGSDQIAFNCPSPGAYVINAPFVWLNPPPLPAGSDHYCLFAKIVTPTNPNPQSDIDSVTDMAYFIMNHCNWAWRNVNFTAPTQEGACKAPLNVPSGTVFPAGGLHVECNIAGYSLPSDTRVSYSYDPQSTIGSADPPLIMQPVSNGNNTTFNYGLQTYLTPDPVQNTFRTPIFYNYVLEQGGVGFKLELSCGVITIVGSPFYRFGRTRPGDWYTSVTIGACSTIVSPTTTSSHTQKQEHEKDETS